MWSYYGSKSKIVDCYPPPKYGKIIEPFAGSARYALKYWDRDVLLVDKYSVIVDIWKWLQQCSENDILKLPRVKHEERLNDIQFDCIEARNLMGFLIKSGAATPANKPSSRRTTDRPNMINYALNDISSNLKKIRHWNIVLDDYLSIENEESTWFIDPPYQFGGEHYKESSKNLNFENLADWCKTRNGQVIVCENTKADWMDFKPIRKIEGSANTNTIEAIWGNLPTAFDHEQLSLF